MMILAPVVKDRKGEHEKVFEDARRAGFVRVRVDGELPVIRGHDDAHTGHLMHAGRAATGDHRQQNLSL